MIQHRARRGKERGSLAGGNLIRRAVNDLIRRSKSDDSARHSRCRSHHLHKTVWRSILAAISLRISEVQNGTRECVIRSDCKKRTRQRQYTKAPAVFPANDTRPVITCIYHRWLNANRVINRCMVCRLDTYVCKLEMMN